MQQDICVVSAMSSNFVIGDRSRIPWKLSQDMRRFVELTTGNPVIMGRKTWLSIGSKPLPNRQNIIISSRKDFEHSGALVTQSIGSALSMFSRFPKIMVIGGASIYKEASTLATSAELTMIDRVYVGDVLFPQWLYTKARGWLPIAAKTHRAENDDPQYTFISLKRIPK